jgi:Domain of unknown function (DUF6265)
MTRIADARALANAPLPFVLLFFAIATFNVAVPAQQLTGAPARESHSKGPVPSKAALETPKAALAEFSWLAGYWQGQWGPRVAQQVWMPAQSRTMVGVFQLSENTQTTVVELYTIVSTSSGIELRVRRFTPSLTAWAKSAVLNLTSIDAKSMLFENPTDGQPKTWSMRRTGADTLVERFEIVPQKGQQQVAEIVFHRQPASAPPSR